MAAMNPTHPVTLAVPPETTDHSQGQEHARVVVVEYGDFECPTCKLAATTPTLFMERFPNQVRFIFRNFPLEEAHPHALLAAQAAEAAGAQGKFWPMYDLLFRNQAHLKAPDLQRYAKELNLDMALRGGDGRPHLLAEGPRAHRERPLEPRSLNSGLLFERSGPGYLLRHEVIARRGGRRRVPPPLGIQ
jgi:hypothetical protein